MITYKKNIFEDRLKKARDYFLHKGLIALDGSGDERAEWLFFVISHFKNGDLRIEP